MSVGARDTVNIDESMHEIYKQLTDGADPVNAPFKTMKDVFIWAACIGYKHGDRRPIIGKKLTIFRWAQFSLQTDIPVVKAISLAAGADIDVLVCQEEILNILEEYANSGISHLANDILNDTGQPLYSLIKSIDS